MWPRSNAVLVGWRCWRTRGRQADGITTASSFGCASLGSWCSLSVISVSSTMWRQTVVTHTIARQQDLWCPRAAHWSSFSSFVVQANIGTFSFEVA